MPALTTAQIKNFVRRSFREIVDPSPDKNVVPKIWNFFENRCAYCDKALEKLNKDGHIDHLISASKHGKNHISNRVLSCATCNEKEKLDQDWDDFLKKKAPSPKLYQIRKKRIEKWIEIHNPDGSLKYDEEMVALALEYAEKVNHVYVEFVNELKGKVRAGKK